MKPNPDEIKKYDYLILTVEPWETAVGTNGRDITRVLAQRGRVLFVNPAPDWSTRIKSGSGKGRLLRDAKKRRQGKRLIEAEPNTWVLYPNVTLSSINWLPDSAVYDRFNRQNNALLTREIRWALEQLGMDNVVLFNDSEMYRGFYLKEMVQPACYVYYIRDNTMVVDYWRRHGERLEPALMNKADLVVANSANLREVAARSNSNSVNIGQGCDLSNFVADVRYPEPADLAGLPHPRIGYAGALTATRLDIPLLVELATSRPQWQLMLLGTEDGVFQNSPLHSLANVHFLGSKPITELPTYLQHLDVLINPQLLNALTIGNYPRKIDEYLAMGKPVVATRTEAMELFAEHVLLADNARQFINQVENALLDRDPALREARVAFASEHSWANCVRDIEAAVWNTLNPQTAPKENILEVTTY